MVVKRTWKDRLLDKYVDHTLIRMLILSFWLRTVFGLFLLGVLAMAIAVPRIWRVSPPGVEPVIEVSLVDLVQAWSLRREAAQRRAAGQHDAALQASYAAVRNNPADVNLCREALAGYVQAQSLEGRWSSQVQGWVQRLLLLTRTNRQEFGLVARVYDRLAMPDQVLQLLGPVEKELTSGEEASYLKALFETGRVEEFGQRWGRLPSPPGPGDQLGLYRAAYLVGWGPPESAAEARAVLQAAAQDPARRVETERLRLVVAVKTGDAAGFATSLRQLEEMQAVRLRDRTQYWRLLKGLGRGAEAARLARAYAEPPADAGELEELAGVLLELGETQRSADLVRQHAATFGNADTPEAWRVWAVTAGVLITSADWSGLQLMALRARTLSRGGAALAGFSHYMEGRALAGLGRPEQAVAAYDKAVAEGFPDADVALRVGADLVRIGQHEVAWKILGPLEGVAGHASGYWRAVGEMAHALRQDEGQLLQAARQARELEPRDPVAEYNLAVALLVSRQQPEEAVRLTLDYLGRHPDAAEARLYHAAALAMVGRFDEARVVMAAVALEGLSELDRARYHLAAVEAYAGLGQAAAAREHLSQVDDRFLFPSQMRWLDEARRRLK